MRGMSFWLILIWVVTTFSCLSAEEKSELVDEDRRLLEKLISPNKDAKKKKKRHQAPGIEDLPWHYYSKLSDSGETRYLWNWPTKGDKVNSVFGMRNGNLHKGVDISCERGEGIKAAASGRVVHSGWIRGYGHTVILYHGGGISTLYAHLDQIAVPPLMYVSEGSEVGYAGDSGRSTGVHLHFEIRRNGRPFDPMQLRYQGSFKDVLVVRAKLLKSAKK